MSSPDTPDALVLTDRELAHLAALIRASISDAATLTAWTWDTLDAPELATLATLRTRLTDALQAIDPDEPVTRATMGGGATPPPRKERRDHHHDGARHHHPTRLAARAARPPGLDPGRSGPQTGRGPLHRGPLGDRPDSAPPPVP
jgi:hypothetical protein